MLQMVGYEVTFLGWSLYGLPITAIMVLLIWFLLFKIFPTDAENVQNIEQKFIGLNNKQKLTLFIFILAIILWVTGSLQEPIAILFNRKGHGLSSSMISLFKVFLLFLTGLLRQNDISKIDWNTLLLFGGGLSLGSALEVSGTTTWIGQNLTSIASFGSNFMVFLVFGFSALIFSMIASNTASANILIPISISTSIAVGINPVILAVLVAITSSLDFMLPIGTPPNAIAYSTGKIKVKEMIKAGLLLDLAGALLTIILAYVFWGLFS